jgi:hypothetical protein
MGGTGGTSVRGQGDRVHALVRADQELTERGRGRRVRPQGPRPPVSLGLGASLNGVGRCVRGGGAVVEGVLEIIEGTESTEPCRWYVDTGLVSRGRRWGGGEEFEWVCARLCTWDVAVRRPGPWRADEKRSDRLNCDA